MLEVPHLLYLLYSFKRNITNFLRCRIKKLFQKPSGNKNSRSSCWKADPCWLESPLSAHHTKATAGSGAHTPQIYQHTIPSLILFHGKVVKPVFCSSFSRKALCQLCWSHPHPRGTTECLWHLSSSQVSHTQRKALLREDFLPDGWTWNGSKMDLNWTLNGPKMDKELHLSSTHG